MLSASCIATVDLESGSCGQTQSFILSLKDGRPPVVLFLEDGLDVLVQRARECLS